MTRHLVIAWLAVLTACGGGVPIQIRIDEYTMKLSMEDAMDQATGELQAAHLLPPGTARLPELWPESLPDIQYTLAVPTEPVPIDLTPDEGTPEAEKYQEINQAKEAVQRIEINRLVLRVDQSNLSVPLPELALQIADAVDASPDDRRAWFTIGRLPDAAPGFVGDLEFDWELGGETLLNSQLGDEQKELALRTVGRIAIDTAANPAMPRGIAMLRLIVVATFFVEPIEAL